MIELASGASARLLQVTERGEVPRPRHLRLVRESLRSLVEVVQGIAVARSASSKSEGERPKVRSVLEESRTKGRVN